MLYILEVIEKDSEYDCMKTELVVSVTALLTLAISLITVGVDYLNAGDTATGTVSIICGIALLVVTVILYEWGIIQTLKEKTTPITWKSDPT